MRGPRLAGLGLDVGEAGAWWWSGYSDNMLAARTLNLAAGKAGGALQRLVAVRTVELEFGGAHSLHTVMRKSGAKNMREIHTYF